MLPLAELENMERPALTKNPTMKPKFSLFHLTIRKPFLAISPQKLRPIANLIRNREVKRSLDILFFLPQKGARMIFQTLQAALRQAEKKAEQKEESFYVSQIRIDQGSVRKKLSIRAKGSSDLLRQPSSRLVLSLSSGENAKYGAKS